MLLTRFHPPFRPSAVRHKAIVFAMLVLALSLACSAAAATPDISPTLATEPSATFTPEPTSTTSPSPTALQPAAVDAFAVLEEFLEELGPRASATDQELAAAQYLQSRFQELGFDTELQTFSTEDISLAGPGLTLTTPQLREFTATPLVRSGLGDVSGALTPVGLATPGDLPEAGLEGQIALAKRGVITFQSKVDNVFAAGAVGLVVYNNVPGPFQGVLAIQPGFPVIAVSKEDGESIEALLAESDVDAAIKLTLEELPSRNVIAEKTGSGRAVVVLGGHYDSVPGIPGANDNASGTAALLAMAEALADVDLPFTLRIIAFGSEELGLLGSRFYIESLSEDELNRTRVMLNFDTLGSGNGISVFGSRDLTRLTTDLGNDIGIEVAVTRGIDGGSSDYASFQNAGVPYMMLYGDDFSRIHTESDSIEFAQPEILADATAIANALLLSGALAELIGIE